MSAPSGDIKDLTIPWLFQELRTEKKTGTVVLSRDAEVKKVFFRSGEIIYASSNLDTDQLGNCLIASGKLTPEQHGAVQELAAKTGKPLGAVLIERGLITPRDLVAGAKLQVRQIVFSLLPWRDGLYRVDIGPLPPTEVVPLQMSTGALLFEGLRDLDWKIVRKMLPPLKTVLTPSRDVSLRLQGIDLEHDHRSVLTLIDGSRSIEELCVLSDIGDFSTLKALYLLIALRLAEVTGAKTAEQVKQAVDHIAAGAQVAAAAETLVTRETILHAFNSLEIQDYYEILGIGRSATPEEIKKAYFHLAKIYHPDRSADGELGDMKPTLEKLFVNIHEAYDILSTKDKHDQYNMDLASGVKRYRSDGQKPAQQQENKKLSAGVQFSEGMKQLRVQNFWGAEEAFRWAVRLDPSNPDYVFYQGLALAYMPRRRHEAEEYFRKAVEMAPSKIEYLLEIGNFYAKNGLKTKALSVYQDALRRDPNSEKIKQAIKNAGG